MGYTGPQLETGNRFMIKLGDRLAGYLSRALAFTHLNQSLLFNGKTGTFSQLLQ